MQVLYYSCLEKWKIYLYSWIDTKMIKRKSVIEIDRNIKHTFILKCEVCCKRVDTGIEAFRDGSHIICSDCSIFQDVFHLMCDYLKCEADSVSGLKLKKYLKDIKLEKYLKRNHE